MSRKFSARLRARQHSAARAFLFASALAFPAPPARAQEAAAPRPQAAPAREEEVVRINSELVQTDIAVFDKSGKFVDGLTREQIELLVDGRPQAVSFFERVKAGAFDEEAQLAAARGRPRAGAASAVVRPLDRGRLFFLFFDDLHIRPGSLQRTRETMLRFVDEQMGQNDSAAVFTASGQLGFLQQLTDDKTVLRLAVKRLAPRWVDTRETGEQNPITEFQAFAIERGDRTVLDYFIDRLNRERCLGPIARPRGAAASRTAQAGGACSPAGLERLVRARASAVV
ncbi:MAG TPA: VWA domain-containing protein, partial [Pyrinomonadaceae bacterium]